MARTGRRTKMSVKRMGAAFLPDYSTGVFAGGSSLARRALFFTTGQYQRSDLSIRLGCEFNEKGTVRTGKYETTHLRGLYVAGDASRAVQWVVVAASEGAEAAFAINTDLIKEDLL